MPDAVYFFGCGYDRFGRPQKGHLDWSHQWATGAPVLLDTLGLYSIPPGGPARDQQGQGSMELRDGWTCLVWWDRSVDARQNCISALVTKSPLSFDELIAHARRFYPGLLERQPPVECPVERRLNEPAGGVCPTCGQSIGGSR